MPCGVVVLMTTPECPSARLLNEGEVFPDREAAAEAAAAALGAFPSAFIRVQLVDLLPAMVTS